ncbi:hypothetical protein ACFYWN_31215 [Streptomyces sp. NPDC002917]|nr:hypothetical protein [Streptomyces sp. NBC_00562]WUC21253.1 hypothetical protein OHA33_21650 [Streptomyces sp. NBC_00562]
MNAYLGRADNVIKASGYKISIFGIVAQHVVRSIRGRTQRRARPALRG